MGDLLTNMSGFSIRFGDCTRFGQFNWAVSGWQSVNNGGQYEVACPGIGREGLVWETSKVRSVHDKKNSQ